jgi:circadian clock protein KaiB
VPPPGPAGTPAGAEARYLLRIYVSSADDDPEAAAEEARREIERLGVPARVEVLDILHSAAQAAEDRVVATPYVLRVIPAPLLRAVGSITSGIPGLLGVEISADADSGAAHATPATLPQWAVETTPPER